MEYFHVLSERGAYTVCTDLKDAFRSVYIGPKIASHLIFTSYLGGGLVGFVQIVKAIFLY